VIARDRRRWQVAAAVVSCLLLAVACGSQVDPNDFVGAGGAAPGAFVGGSGQPIATDSNGVPLPVGGGRSSGGVLPPGSPGGGQTNGGVPPPGSGGGGNHNSGGGNHNSGGGGNPGGSGVSVASCAGFKNQTGITDSTITIANVADLSGPVPNLFKSAQAAVTAYVAYFNSTSSICGRKLKLIDLDSGTSESGDQQASQSACGSAFAMVGSMGAFDAGGASTVANCGIPDLRAASTETARQKSPVTFGAYSLATNEIPSAPFDWFKSKFGGAYKDAAFVYLNAGASSLNANSFMAGETKLGYHFKDKIAIDVTSVPNYNGYATQLKSDGIKYVQYLGAYQYAQKLKAAMEQQDYHPTFVMDSVAYDPNFVEAGSSVDNTYVFLGGPMFEEANRNPQLATYLQWLQRTSGGQPSFFGTYAWSAAALFVESALSLGGKLTRSSLIGRLRGVHNWTNHGMTQPQDVGSTHTTKCFSVIQLQRGHWVRRTPYPYTCGGVIDSGVG
jgi:ABC-type branched-subunit amino acid transport system substrate-binding protein